MYHLLNAEPGFQEIVTAYLNVQDDLQILNCQLLTIKLTSDECCRILNVMNYGNCNDLERIAVTLSKSTEELIFELKKLHAAFSQGKVNRLIEEREKNRVSEKDSEAVKKTKNALDEAFSFLDLQSDGSNLVEKIKMIPNAATAKLRHSIDCCCKKNNAKSAKETKINNRDNGDDDDNDDDYQKNDMDDRLKLILAKGLMTTADEVVAAATATERAYDNKSEYDLLCAKWSCVLF